MQGALRSGRLFQFCRKGETITTSGALSVGLVAAGIAVFVIRGAARLETLVPFFPFIASTQPKPA
jgi:hypothetical protein